jgi:hypothetical protein
MRMFKTLRIALLVSGLTVTSGAYAGLYVGVGVGQSESDPEQVSDPDTQEVLDEFEEFGGTVSDDPKADSMKAFIGYRANSFFALEGGMLNMGDIYESEASIDDGTFAGSGSSKVEVDGTYLALVGHVPLGFLSVNARVGTYKWDAKFSGEAEVTSPLGSASDSFSDSADGDDSFYGIGLDIGIFSVQYEQYKLEDADIDYLGINLKFGS